MRRLIARSFAMRWTSPAAIAFTVAFFALAFLYLYLGQLPMIVK